MDHEFVIDGARFTLAWEAEDDELLVVSIGDKILRANVCEISPSVYSVLVGDRAFAVFCACDRGIYHVFCNGQHFELAEPDDDSDGFLTGEGRTAADDLLIKAPMPGKVIKINVTEGEEVHRNQTLAIVEAMKMENEIKSALDGVVRKIHASPGELVDNFTPLIELARKE